MKDVTREEARARRKQAGEWLGAAWGAALLPNLLAAFGFEPGGWALVRERRSPAVER